MACFPIVTHVNGSDAESVKHPFGVIEEVRVIKTGLSHLLSVTLSLPSFYSPSVVPRLSGLLNVCTRKEGEHGRTYHMRADLRWNQLPYMGCHITPYAELNSAS